MQPENSDNIQQDISPSCIPNQQLNQNSTQSPLQELQAAFKAHQQFKKDKSVKVNRPAIYSRTIRFLNKERKKMQKSIKQFCYEKVKEKYQSQRELLLNENPQIKNQKLKYLEDNESFCGCCSKQIFNFYVYGSISKMSKKRGYICLYCYFQKQKKPKGKLSTLYKKYDLYYLQTLFYILQNQNQDQGVVFSFQQKQIQSQKQEIYIPPEVIIAEQRNILHQNMYLYQIINQMEQLPKRTKIYNFTENACQTQDVKILQLNEIQNQKKQKKKKKKQKKQKQKKDKQKARSVSPVFSGKSIVSRKKSLSRSISRSKSPVKFNSKPFDNSSNSNFNQEGNKKFSHQNWNNQRENSSIDANSNQGENTRHRGFNRSNDNFSQRGRGRGDRGRGRFNHDNQGDFRGRSRGRGRGNQGNEGFRGRDRGRGRGRGRDNENEGNRNNFSFNNNFDDNNNNTTFNLDISKPEQIEAPDDY